MLTGYRPPADRQARVLIQAVVSAWVGLAHGMTRVERGLCRAAQLLVGEGRLEECFDDAGECLDDLPARVVAERLHVSPDAELTIRLQLQPDRERRDVERILFDPVMDQA